MNAGFRPRTANDYAMDEASSALQKEIRRGNELEAVFWAQELEPFFRYLWRRLIGIYHEDVGLADPDVLPYLEICRQHYFEMLEAGHPENLPLINAVVRLCRAKKTRLSISLHLMVYETEMLITVPDYALDMHTAAGRRMGRGMDHFHQVGNHLENQDKSVDPYEEDALQIGKSSKPRASYARFVAARKAKKGKKATKDESEQLDLF